MRLKALKIASLAMLVICALGLAGTFSPASAAGEITINGGAQATNYHQVTLSLFPPPGSTQMSFRNESGTWSAWEPVAATRAWTLSVNDGDKRVSVQFQNSSGIPTGAGYATIKLGYILDLNFFSRGWRNEAIPATTQTAGRAVAVQPDGRIVTVGTVDLGSGNSNIEVIRYLPDGSLDPGFVGGGKWDWPGSSVPGAHTAGGVAIDPVSGKIVVVGTYDDGGNQNVLVMRLNTNGTLDTTFTGGPTINAVGFLILDAVGGTDNGNAVAVQPDGKIVVVGTYDKGGANGTAPWVLRLNAGDGSLDGSFNGSGSLTFAAAPGQHSGNAVALQADGRIVVVGTYDHDLGNYSVWALRLTAAGAMDTTFGRGSATPGLMTGEITFGAFGVNAGSGVAINPSTGTISVVGTYDWIGGDTDIWLLQLNGSDGSLDTSFNAGSAYPGTITLGGLGSGLDSGKAVAVQPDGRIVVAGVYDNGAGSTALLVQRLNGDGTFDTAFNNGNSVYSFGTAGKFAGNALALQADGKIVVVGTGDNLAGTSSILTMRLHDKTYPLTVSVIGIGTVTASPGTLVWSGSTGSASYIPNTLVTLTPSGGTFLSWSGACTGSGACTVTMDAAKNVTANFVAPLLNLNVTVIGTGSVTVCEKINAVCSTSNTCLSGTCTYQYPYGSTLELTATPAWYSDFIGWGGDCSGNGVCTPLFTQARTVYAAFNKQQNVMLQSATPSYYATLLEAYQSVPTSGSSSFAVLTKEFPEGTLSLDRPVTFTIDGGKAGDFTTPSGGYTTLVGPLKISNGRVNARMFIIK